MASKIIVDQLESSGSNITIPTGTGLVVTDGIAATNLSGTIADARLPTVPVAKGGTGLTSLGSAGQVVQVNSGGNALEFAAAAGGNAPYFYGAKASAQTLSRGTITKVTGLTQDEQDSDTAFDGTTFTVPSGKNGIYYLQGVVTGQYGTAGNDGEATSVYIYKNGSEIKQGSFFKNGASANYADLSQAQVECSIITSLAVGDTIELYGRLVDFNNSAGGDVMAGQSHLMGFKIG
jgi:hypothetical protein